uniref:Outer membrane lipoprotein n=1 Tax=Pasteurella multocida TaxID=747 RepID=C6KF94_PASMD|nr:outer membrane lipoprotein [Pasteurella multocida]
MKQIVLKTSLLMTLSSLLVACSGGGGSAGNRADRVEEKAQPVQSNSEPSSTPIKHPMTNSATNTSLHDKLSMSSHDTSKENSQQSSFQAPLEQEKNQPAQENLTWTGYHVSQWGNASNNVDKDNVTVFTFVKYNSQYNDDPVFDKTKTQSKTISLVDGKNENKEHYYHFTLKDDLFYYGSYGQPSSDYKKIEENYIYAIKPDAINNENINALTATYHQEDGFIYSVLSDVNRVGSEYIPQYGNVSVTIQNGKIYGEIYRHNRGYDDLFKLSEEGRNLILTPHKNNPYDLSPTGPDNMTMELNFINAEKTDKKYVVGVGKAEKYYGLLFAEKSHQAQ